MQYAILSPWRRHQVRPSVLLIIRIQSHIVLPYNINIIVPSFNVTHNNFYVEATIPRDAPWRISILISIITMLLFIILITFTSIILITIIVIAIISIIIITIIIIIATITCCCRTKYPRHPRKLVQGCPCYWFKDMDAHAGRPRDAYAG